jgi:hypothetical protein
MNDYLQAVGLMAALDIGRGSRDAHGRRRQYTADELDALADFGRRLPDLKGVLVAGAHVVRMRSRWQPRRRHHLDPTALPSAVTPSH